MNSKKGFTLIELLAVVSIVAVLAVIVVTAVNPPELLRQARDGQRASDLSLIQKSIFLVAPEDFDGPNHDDTCYGEGDQRLYVSVPSGNGETTTTPPAGWLYSRAASTTFKKIDGTGWVPVDFTKENAIGTSLPLSVLPVDPINKFTSGYFYEYACEPFELSAALESRKALLKVGPSDGGTDANSLEVGKNLALIPAKGSATAPAPTASSFSPNSSVQSSTASLTLNGANFVDRPSVAFSGTGITITGVGFMDSSHLNILIRVSSTAPLGAQSITVTNPDSQQGTCTGCFTVTSAALPAPTVTSASPSSLIQGATSQTVAVNGSDFVSGATVAMSGTGITINSVTFVSSAQLSAIVTVSSTAATTTRTITVTNPDTQQGTCGGCFTVTGTAPAPTATSVSPSSRGQGATSASLTVNGTNFVSGATVAMSGTGITVNSVTFNSATQLTVNVNVSSTAATGARNVTVTNPDTQAGTCTSCFTVNAKPSVTSASPSSRGQGASSQAITVNGTNFQSGATAVFSGTGITVNSVTFVSASQLTVNIDIGSSATTGARDITVTNPDNGQGTCSGCFTVNTKPGVTSASPSSRGQGASAQVITINGSNFVSGATVALSGTGITVNSVTFVSAAQLTANLTIASSATTGARDITVTNPDAGQGTCTGCFTVNTKPGVTSASPSSDGQGASNQTVLVNGSSFVSGATVAMSGTGITINSVTFVSSAQLSVNLTVGGSATTGARDITVTNPDAGQGTCTGCYTVNAAPTVSTLSPATGAQSSTQSGVAINGTNFQSGATVSVSGSGVTASSVTFVNSTQLTATITVTAGAATGARDVTVTNPDSGSGIGVGDFTVTTAAAPASTTITYMFTNTFDGFSAPICTGITCSRITNDGSSAGGALEVALATKNLTTQWQWELSGITWESLGVPVGATVTNVDGSYDHRVASSTNPGASNSSGNMTIADSGGTSIALLESQITYAGTVTSWATQNATGNVAIPGGSQASNTSIRVRLTGSISGAGGATTPNMKLRQDQIVLIITYTP